MFSGLDSFIKLIKADVESDYAVLKHDNDSLKDEPAFNMDLKSKMRAE